MSEHERELLLLEEWKRKREPIRTEDFDATTEDLNNRLADLEREVAELKRQIELVKGAK